MLWLIALPIAMWLRVDLSLGTVSPITLRWWTTLAIIIIAAAAIGYFLGIYSKRNRIWPGTRTEDIALALTHFGAGTVGLVFVILTGSEGDVPRSVPLIAAIEVIGGTILLRSIIRWITFNTKRPKAKHRAVIIGAGENAVQFLRTYNDPNLQIVGVMSGEMDRVGALIHGVRVKLLTEEALLDAITNSDADTFLLIQDHSDLHEDYSAVHRVATQNNIRLRTWPAAGSVESRRGGAQGAAFRDLDPMELIGREAKKLHIDAVRNLIENRVVLVTGAGGSIGSEICRQVKRLNPRTLYLLDRDEGGIHATELSLVNSGLLNTPDILLADIRDADTLHSLFQRAKPDIVFHTAALKHYPILENFPDEAFKTNVVGTYNVLKAAADAGVNTFVNVSTDKAADPSTVLGYSKRAAERITAGFIDRFPGVCVSVRFGNVFGSRGSVLTTFQDQIRSGGPVTVTDREVERYFMSIPEASQLVLEAAAFGTSGQTMVLDMGEPVKINSIAQKLIDLSGDKSIRIVYSGLRPGEKLSEDLVDPTETPERLKATDSIISVKIDPIEFDQTIAQSITNQDEARKWLHAFGSSALDVDKAGEVKELLVDND